MLKTRVSVGRVRPSLAALLLFACAPDKDPLATMSASHSGGPNPSTNPSTDPSGDPSGDPTDGTTGGTGGADHGLCDAFLVCVAAAVPDTLPANEANFGPNGACWDGPPEIVEQCLATCAEGLESFGALYPDEPACQPAGGTTGEPPATTGPTCEPQSNGADCDPQDPCACASGKCRPYDHGLGDGACSECIDDSDCSGGVCVWSSNGTGAVCRADGLGEQCLDGSCVDPSAPHCAESLGYSTCSECATDDDCDGEERCTPHYDPAYDGYGTYFCRAPGSVPLHGGCPVFGNNVNKVCATGLCALVTAEGQNFGACSECSIDAHCPPGEKCAYGDFDYQQKKLTGRVCQ